MTALVTGASRGLGAGIAAALVEAGHEVVGLARGADELKARAAVAGFFPVAADATDPAVAQELLSLYEPDVLVLNAGAVPPMAALSGHTWESFSRSWEVDVRHVFEWTSAALRLPLRPGSVVVTISSGAALRGSPLSGGYAGAKATARFISSYAADESERAGLGLRFVTLLPQLTTLGGVGAAGAEGYAAQQGISIAAYTHGFEPLLTPALMGQAVLDAITPGGPVESSALVSGAGVRPLG